MTEEDPHAGHAGGLVVVRLVSAGLIKGLTSPPECALVRVGARKAAGLRKAEALIIRYRSNRGFNKSVCRPYVIRSPLSDFPTRSAVCKRCGPFLARSFLISSAAPSRIRPKPYRASADALAPHRRRRVHTYPTAQLGNRSWALKDCPCFRNWASARRRVRRSLGLAITPLHRFK